MMKLITTCLVFILSLVASAQVDTTLHVARQKRDYNMEKFDFKTYEKYKELSGENSIEYRKKDGTIVYMSKSFDYLFIRETPPDPFFIEKNKEFYKNGNLWKESNTYKKGGFILGIEYIYSEHGELMSEINHDEGYTYSLYDVLNFCKQNNIEIKNITRNDPTESDVYVWRIRGNGKFNGEEGSYEMELDGANGELLLVKKGRFEIINDWGLTVFDEVYKKETEKKNKMSSTLIDGTSDNNKWTPLID